MIQTPANARRRHAAKFLATASLLLGGGVVGAAAWWHQWSAQSVIVARSMPTVREQSRAMLATPHSPLPQSQADQTAPPATIVSFQSPKTSRKHSRSADRDSMSATNTQNAALLDHLLNEHQYEEVEAKGLSLILNRPFDLETIYVAQRARVQALLAKKDASQAVEQAKALFNVAPQNRTRDAVDLAAQAIKAAKGPDAAAAFINCQSTTDGSSDNPLASVTVDPTVYQDKISGMETQRDSKGHPIFRNIMAEGNLHLLADQPWAAGDNFVEARDAMASRGDQVGRVRDALEGLANVARAEHGSVPAGDAYLFSLRSSAANDTAANVSARSIARAASLAMLSDLRQSRLPASEVQREASITTELPSASPFTSPITITADLDTAPPIEVHQTSPTQFAVTLQTRGFTDWFMFRVAHAAGQTLRIDLHNSIGGLDHWRTVDPIYMSTKTLDDPSQFLPVASATNPTLTAWNGPQTKTFAASGWRTIPDVWTEDNGNTLSFVQHFDADDATVAMRLPYTPALNQRYFDSLAGNANVNVVQVGRSANDLPLLMAQVGVPPAGGATKPCVLVYAGEHADEFDAMWTAHGLLDFLAGGSAQAKALRDRCTFLIVPMLDPDATLAGKHASIISSFTVPTETPESVDYGNWFEQWIAAGHRLDVVLDLHNVQSSESTQVACAIVEGGATRGAAALAIHQRIVAALTAAGIEINDRPWMRGTDPTRLGGWLGQRFGAFTLGYELNSQAPARHLDLADLNLIGTSFATAAGELFRNDSGAHLLACVDRVRTDRQQRYTKLNNYNAEKNAIDFEAQLWGESTAQADGQQSGLSNGQ